VGEIQSDRLREGEGFFMIRPSTMKFYYSYFSFTSRCLFVEYGDPSIPSHGWWMIPGTWEDQ
jgi:hypothetical protein